MKTFFTSSVTTFQTLGERLRRHRDQHRMSVEDVARETGIPQKYVRALEAGAYHTLPGEAYVRHFLKQYALLLGVRNESIFPVYEQERVIVSAPDHTTKPPSNLPSVRTLHISALLRRVLLFLVVASLAVYLGMKLFVFLSPPPLALTSPAENATLDTTLVTVVGQTEPDVAVSVNGQNVFLDSEGAFTEDVSLRPGLNTIRVIAANGRGKERIVTRNIFVRTQEDGSL